ncbi:MAG: hypothetical protein VB858_00025, partial [Planctomycetaceae bacterium]
MCAREHTFVCRTKLRLWQRSQSVSLSLCSVAALCCGILMNQRTTLAQDDSPPALAAFALLEDTIIKAVEKAEPCVVAIATVR